MLKLKSASLLSFILHPFVFFIVSLFFLIDNLNNKSIILVLLFIVLQTLIILFFTKGQRLSPTLFSSQKERVPLLATSLVLFFVFCWYLLQISTGEFLYFLIQMTAVGALLALIITPFFKISLHAMGVSIFAVVFYHSIGMDTLFFTIPLALLVAWSRIILKAHRPIEIFLGYSLPIIISVFIIKYNGL